MIDNSVVYIQYNNGDKRVTYMHHKPVMLLEQGITEEERNDPSAYKLYVETRERDYALAGKFIPRTNVEMPPEDGHVYEQLFDASQNKVLYRKSDVQMPKEAYFEENINKLNSDLSDVSSTAETLQTDLDTAKAENKELNTIIDELRNVMMEQTREMAKEVEKNEEIRERNEEMIHELMSMVMMSGDMEEIPEEDPSVGEPEIPAE